MEMGTMQTVGIWPLLRLVSKPDRSVENRGLLLSFTLVFFNGARLYMIDYKNI